MNSTKAGGPSGYISMLGGPLLAFGLWMIVQALFLPHEAEAVRLSVITGVFMAGVGGWLLAHRLRRGVARGETTPRPTPPPVPVSGTPQAAADGKPDRGELSPSELLGGGAGCLIISLGFMLLGPIFLWLYFSGAPTRRGNPAMGLVAGILFTAAGFLGVLMLNSRGRKSGRRWGRGDPRRLP